MEENNNTPPATVVDPPAVVDPPTPPAAVVDPPAAVVVPDGYVSKTEVEAERTSRTAAETARDAAEARAKTAEQSLRASEIRAAAQGLNFNDPADAEKFVGADVPADKIAETLADVIKTKGYLVKAAEVVTPPITPTSPTNPARAAALTLDAIKTMTPTQINANWAQVKEVLKGGAAV
jgi:hypothetical protein